MSFTESNTVEAYLYDLLSGPAKSPSPQPLPRGERGFSGVQQARVPYGPAPKGIGWQRVVAADIPRQPQDAFVEPWVKAALIRLNPEIGLFPKTGG